MCKNLFLIFLLTLFLVNGCSRHPSNNNAEKVISINPREAKENVYLSEFVESIEYIKLETNPKCIIGHAIQLFIREKNIYVSDIINGVLYIFDKTGAYLSTFDRQGRGPDEYSHFGPIIVDDEEKHIALASYTNEGNRFLVYSIDTHELISSEPIPDIMANQHRFENDYHYFSTQQARNIVEEEDTNASIIVVKNGEIQKTLFAKTIDVRGQYWSPNIECFTKNDKGTLFTSIMYDNTFYRLENGKAIPEMTIDFGRYTIDNTIGQRSLSDQIAYLKKTENRAAFPVLNINNSDIMAFSYYWKTRKNENAEFITPILEDSELHQYIKIRSTNQVFHTKNLLNDISPFPEKIHLSTFFNMTAHEAWHDDKLIYVISPSQGLSDDSSTFEGLGEVSIEDNPIIVLMKLKK